MMSGVRVQLAGIVLTLTAALLWPQVTLAQASQALSISPLTFELAANPGETVASLVRVYNSSDVEVVASAEVRDFAASGEQGQVALEAAGENTTYSLAAWVSFEEIAFRIPPKSFANVPFLVTVPENAEPGGHYGSILVGLGAGAVEGSGVGVATKVGSLVLLKVSGLAKESLAIESIVAPDFSEYGPITIAARFKNSGTVHVKPVGNLVVTNWLNQPVAHLAIDQRNVLPNSVRKIETVVPGKWRFGRYTATLSIIYGSDNQPLESVVQFWVFPWRVVLAGSTGALLILVFLYSIRRRLKLAFIVLFRGSVDN